MNRVLLKYARHETTGRCS